MLDEKMIEHHRFQLMFHRILYCLLLVAIIITYCWEPNAADVRQFLVLIGTIVIFVAEMILSHKKFWNKKIVLLVTTYIQYAFYLFMMYLLLDISCYTTLSIGALMLVFMFEYSYYSDITDNLKNVYSVLILVLPAFVCMVVYFCIVGVSISGFLTLLAYLMFCVMDILIVHLFYLNEHSLLNENDRLFFQIESMKNMNDELTSFKNRIQKVNEELNLQRVKLGQMNREIKQSNSELAVQAELLKHINGSLSKDIPSFIKYIIDAIMKTRHVEFCGIYIDKNVYYNKRPLISFNCSSNPDVSEIPEILTLYESVTNREDDWTVIKDIQSQDYPGLSQTNVASVLVLPLVLNEEKYGILIIGSKRRNVFDEHITFYDVIVPQFNLAINNIRIYEQMKHIAQTDGLTGINNRTYFNKLYSEQMERTIEGGQPLSVALFDIDKFKRINDTYGHLVGDEVIKTIARLAFQCIEESELGFICRYGGEEFVIVLPNKNEEEALPIIQNLHQEIAHTTVEAYGHVVSMTVSIGLTSYPALCDDINQLLKRADWSMYFAKEHGRNQVKVDGPDVTEVK